MKKLGVFELCFFFGVKPVHVGLDHLVLSDVYLFGLLDYLPNMLPFELLLIVLENVLGLER